jgi:hypothetical protein
MAFTSNIHDILPDYNLSQKDEVRLGMGHGAWGIPHFFDNRYIYVNANTSSAIVVF